MLVMEGERTLCDSSSLAKRAVAAAKCCTRPAGRVHATAVHSRSPADE